MGFKTSHPWFRSRGYLHFDRQISYKTAQKIVTSPKKVSQHSFYPLINYTIDAKKIRQDKATGLIEVKKKERPIAYSSHVDSHIYAYYSYLLSKSYELELESKGLGECVLAFRSLGKSNIEFANNAFNCIKHFGNCGVVALDLSKFFDELDHKILKHQWANTLHKITLPSDHYNVFKSLTKYATIDKDLLYSKLNISNNNPRNGRDRVCEPLEFRNVVRSSGLIKTKTLGKGIPQGSPISSLLSNIYLIDFDLKMKKYVENCNGFYFRYCDDMLFIVPIDQKDEVEGLAQKEITKLRLTINTNKTERRTFQYRNGVLKADKPLQYLGFLFNGENIYLRSSSLARYSERMKKAVKLAKSTKRKIDFLKIGRGESTKPLYKSKLYRKYSHLGKRNFITYGFRAAKIMDSKTIRKQLKPLWGKLQREIK
ncbi:MAG: RNA-directed DNA polymerase [Parvicella sp.]